MMKQAIVNEAEEIGRAQQHDHAAWLILVTRHQEAVFRMAYLLLGNADDAQDVAQETFLQAFRHLQRFDRTRPLRPWLLQIAKNRARNRRRSVRRYLAAWQRWWQNPAQQATFTAHHADSELIWQAVQRLRVSDQEIIYLRYFLELSVHETAATLGVAEGTVKSRLARALARLRVLITQDFPELHPSTLKPLGAREEVAE